MLVANMQILAGHQKPPYVFKSQIRKTAYFNTHTDCYMQENLVCKQEQEHIKYLILCQVNISLSSSPFYLNVPPPFNVPSTGILFLIYPTKTY